MSRTNSLDMTLAEAILIEQQLGRGKLDETLPGTRALISEARRIQFNAALPKKNPALPRRDRRPYLAAIVCLGGMAGVFGLAFEFFLTAL